MPSASARGSGAVRGRPTLGPAFVAGPSLTLATVSAIPGSDLLSTVRPRTAPEPPGLGSAGSGVQRGGTR